MPIYTQTHITSEIQTIEYEVENFNTVNCFSNNRNTSGVTINVRKTEF